MSEPPTDSEVAAMVEEAIGFAQTDAGRDAALVWAQAFGRYLKAYPHQARRIHQLGGGGIITFCAGWLAAMEMCGPTCAAFAEAWDL